MTSAQPVLAALWDMDGVLVTTADFHFEAWSRLGHEIGHVLPRETFERTFGQRNDFILRDWVDPNISAEQIQRYADLKERYYREAVKGRVRPLPGALELLRALRAQGFRNAMASAAPRPNVELILQELDAFALFDAVVTGDDVTAGKPDPAVYLLCARRVAVSPERCLVLEDAVAGVEGAQRAGMACIGVASTHPHSLLARADLVVDNLLDVTPQTVADLILRRQR